MAKFRYVFWLLEFLKSRSEFVFEWDDGNSVKNLDKHGVENYMVESIFSDTNLLALGQQYEPSTNESRYGIIGMATFGSILFVCFTIRGNKIRPISARFANQKERGLYEKEIR